MEDVTCGLTQLDIEQKEKELDLFCMQLIANIAPDDSDQKEYKIFGVVLSEEEEKTHDANNEETSRKTFENEVSEADLDTVQVRYIPDYIRELKHQEEYWKKEVNIWGDVISQRNWTHYAKRVHEELNRNKTVLWNLYKYAAKFDTEIGNTHFSQSLDPERVQRLVDYIKEKESEDERFVVWEKAALYTRQHIKICYQKYAVFARYGDFRARPSRLNLAKAAESRNLPQN